MINAIGLDRGLHMDFGSFAGYGIPYQVVSGNTPRSTVTFEYDDDSDHVGYPSPSARSRGWLGRHILMVDKDLCRLYELFAAAKVNGAWTAGSGATWDLRSNDLRTEGWTSADAAGLPILPGLVRYDEVAAGAIAHALRFTTNQTRTRVHLPRPPLRQLVDLDVAAADGPAGPTQERPTTRPGFSPQARVIAVALQRYGMILADNGSPWYITGVSDPNFDDDVMHELDVITGRDLEVVDTSGLVNGP